MTLIERLSAEDYIPTSDHLRFVDVFELHALFDAIAFKANLNMVGPTGIAKSLAYWTWCAKHKCPLVPVECSEDIRRMHLVGCYQLQGDQTPFMLGPVPTAIEIANEHGRCVLWLGEVNALRPETQKMLNALLDFRQAVVVQEVKRVYRLQPGKKLWVVADMNTAAHGGVYQLNMDLKSRFRTIPLNYPKPKDEKAVVKEVAAPCDDKTLDRVLMLAHQTRQNALEYQLSPRDVCQIVDDIAVLGVSKALLLALGKFEDDDQTTVASWISSMFPGTVLVEPRSTEKEKKAAP